MSTTFGIRLQHGETLEVARRVGGIGLSWTEEWAHMFPPDTKVIALDNTPQGIYTIGDILDAIEGQETVERLRKEYVISEDELMLLKEQQLLTKLYECQDEMEVLLDKGEDDFHYVLMGVLIKRLEDHLSQNLDLC
tara:strand:- start:718 stop:1125 length:408 start_codon:yes stop_codon:yes gene_type:complete